MKSDSCLDNLGTQTALKAYCLNYSKVLPYSSISELIHFPLDRSVNRSYKLENTPRAERERIDNESRRKLFGYFSPPKPFPIAGKGYPYLEVTYNKFHIWFTSTFEIDHFSEVYSQKVLPSARDLAAKHDDTYVNRIWISRLPKLNLKKRLQIVDYISKIDVEFRRIAGERETIAEENLKRGKLVPILGNPSRYYLAPPFDTLNSGV